MSKETNNSSKATHRKPVFKMVSYTGIAQEKKKKEHTTLNREGCMPP